MSDPAKVKIHPSAIVDPGAHLDSSVEVGAFSLIGPDVQIGANSNVGAHCVIEGPTTIGARNTFHPFSRIGGAPQDKKYAGEPTRLLIGDDNMFREYVTINRGTAQDKQVTTIGHHNWIMAYVHVAHDCVLGDQIIIANSTSLAGHVELGNWVILGGFTGVHQFCKIGAHAMTSVGSVVLHDIPPYVMASGSPAGAHGINSEGLRRRDFCSDQIVHIKRAYKSLYKKGLSLSDARQQIALMSDTSDDPAVTSDLDLLSQFLGQVTRGIVR